MWVPGVMKFIFMCGMEWELHAAKTIGIILDLVPENFLELNNVFYVPSMRMNFLSLSLFNKTRM